MSQVVRYERDGKVAVIKLYSYGFPRWRGGPMHWADQEGLPALLVQLVKDGQTFADLNKEQTT